MKKGAKFSIVVLCLIILGLCTFIIVDKVIINEKNSQSDTEEFSNKTINSDNAQNKDNTFSIDGTYERFGDSDRNSDKQKDNLLEANEAIRKALKSPDFFKKYNFPVDDNHEVTFIKLKNYENMPVYFIQSFDEENISVSLMSVSYNDGIVMGEVYINESYMTSLWIDPNDYILKTLTSRFGENTYTFEKYKKLNSNCLINL